MEKPVLAVSGFFERIITAPFRFVESVGNRLCVSGPHGAGERAPEAGAGAADSSRTRSRTNCCSRTNGCATCWASRSSIRLRRCWPRSSARTPRPPPAPSRINKGADDGHREGHGGDHRRRRGRQGAGRAAGHREGHPAHRPRQHASPSGCSGTAKKACSKANWTGAPSSMSPTMPTSRKATCSSPPASTASIPRGFRLRPWCKVSKHEASAFQTVIGRADRQPLPPGRGAGAHEMKPRVYLAILLLIIPVQASLLSTRCRWAASSPILPWRCIYIIGLLTGPVEAALAGMALGLVQDIGSASLIGAHAASPAACRPRRPGSSAEGCSTSPARRTCIFLAAFSLAEGHLHRVLHADVLRSGPLLRACCFTRLVPQALYTGLLGYFLLLRLMNRKNVMAR